MQTEPLEKSQLVDKVKGNDDQLLTTQPLTLNNLIKVLLHTQLHLRFNVMTNEVVYVDNGAVITDEHQCERLELCLRSVLKVAGITGQSDLGPMLTTLARLDSFHPMEEWLRSLPPPAVGADPIGDLIGSVTSSTALWPVFLEKWLVQVVDAVCGWHGRPQVSLPYVLVLAGAQGVGKTEFLRRLGHGWIRSEAELHLGSSTGKDHQIEALRWPMVELSELDGIFRKADIEHMKSFISRSEDSIRVPYGRKAVRSPRRTVFCGSVNEGQFLTDPSGSRRFWPVVVESIDWSAAVDWAGVWAQAFAEWTVDSSFSLTAAEEAERATISLEEHTEMSPEEEMIQDYLSAHIGSSFEEKPMNTVNVMKLLGLNFNNPKAKKAARNTLVKHLGKHRTLSGKQRAWAVPYNEFARDLLSWPTTTTKLVIVSD